MCFAPCSTTPSRCSGCETRLESRITSWSSNVILGVFFSTRFTYDCFIFRPLMMMTTRCEQCFCLFPFTYSANFANVSATLLLMFARHCVVKKRQNRAKRCDLRCVLHPNTLRSKVLTEKAIYSYKECGEDLNRNPA